MRKARLTFIVLSAAAVLAACSTGVQATAAYQLQVAPKAISVNVPQTLVQSGATAKALARGMMPAGSGPLAGHDFEGEHIGAYHWIKQGIWNSQKRLAKASWTMVLLDNYITTNNLVPSDNGTGVATKATTVTWTQAMVDAYKALIPASFANNSNFENVAKLPTVGSTSELSPFTYEKAKTSDAPYSVVVTFGQSSSGEEANSEETKTLFWSADRQQFKFAYKKMDGTVAVEQDFVAFDASTSAMSAGRQDVEHGSMTVEVKADSTAAAKHGAFIWFDATFGKDDSDESALANNATLSISAQGYADDSGGTVSETFTVTAASGAVSVYYVKEGFDATGKLILGSFSTDGVTYTPFIGTGGEVSGYDTKTAAVETEHQNLGASSDAVDQELRSNTGSVGSGPSLVEVKNAGITKGVWAASTDNFATIIGTGYAKEAGEVKLAFTAPPAKGASFSIATFKPVPNSNPPTMQLDNTTAIAGFTF